MTPLNAWKTQTNIGKQLCISQCPSRDTNITKIELLDQILAPGSDIERSENSLKNQKFCIFSNFFHFLVPSGPGNLWKLLSTWKYLPVDIFSTIFGNLEQILGIKIAISNHRNGLRMAIFMPKTYSKVPIMVLNMYTGRYSYVLSCFHRFPGPMVAKKWKKFEKMQKFWFFRPFSQRSRSLQSARIWSMSSILVLFGPLVGHWYMQSCFPMFVCVFQATRGGQKWPRPKNVICRGASPYELRPKRSLAGGTPRHQFFWTFYAFFSSTR